jgi:magnesium transporter
VSLQEKEGDPFEEVRERIRRGTGHIREKGSDYLAYALVDALIDSLYPILEIYGEWIDTLEQDLIHNASPKQMETVQGVKRDLLWMRRCAWPHREVMGTLERPEASDLIAEETRPYFRDCYEHSIQLMDVVETFRDLAGGLTDLYLSSASNRMNEVMKVLTIISSIFIPMTFVAGIYGMNFNPDRSGWNMPELNWIFGYPAALGMMLGIAAIMIAVFKRKRWF